MRGTQRRGPRSAEDELWPLALVDVRDAEQLDILFRLLRRSPLAIEAGAPPLGNGFWGGERQRSASL